MGLLDDCVAFSGWLRRQIGDQMTLESDKDTRGIGVLLRFAGVTIPVALFFLLFFTVEKGTVGDGRSDGLVFSVLRVIAFPWSWPYGLYHHNPISFGAVALSAIIVTVVLILRHDRRGWITTLLFSLVFGWLMATIVGQAYGY